MLNISPKKLIMLARKDIKEKSGWVKSDWENYLAEKFDKLKKTKWTKKVYPELVNIEYDELKDLSPKTFPDYPPNFPSVVEARTTGTVRQKIVKLTSRDLQDLLVVYTKIVLMTLGKSKIGKVFAPIGGREYGTGVGAKLLELMGWKVYTVTPSDFRNKETMEKILKKGPFDAFSGIPIFVMKFLEMFGSRAISEGEIYFLFGGDVLYESILRKLEDIEKESGSTFNIHNLYVSSETAMVGVSLDKKRPNDIHFLPELNILHVGEPKRKENIFKVEVNSEGYVYPTILRDLVIPVYDIGDIIRVIGEEKGLPVFRVMGRKTFKTFIEHPSLGEPIEGLSGALLKLGGIPLHTELFDKAVSPLTSNYLAIFYVKENKIRLVFYSEEKISPKFIEMQFLKFPELNPLIHALQMGLLEIETIRVDLDPSVLKVKGKPPLKLPRIILIEE